MLPFHVPNDAETFSGEGFSPPEELPSRNNGTTQRTQSPNTKKSNHKRSDKSRRRRSPYKKLVRDCLHVIMQFHLDEVKTPVEQISEADADFYSEFAVCLDFHKYNRTNVHQFLERVIRTPKRLRYVDASQSRELCDDSFPFFERIHTLHMSFCSQPSISDKAFEHLRGIHTLSMEYCNQETISSRAFSFLEGINTLKMNAMSQRTIGDEAFVHLKGIHTLHISWCPQITDNAFVHLRGVKTLVMRHQRQVTHKAFLHIRGVEYCDVSYCNPSIRQEAYENFKETKTLIIKQANVAPHMREKLSKYCENIVLN